MRTASLNPGDTVTANVRGYEFPARILDLHDELIAGKPIHIEPLWGGITFFHVAASQIVCKGWDRDRSRSRRAAA